MVDFPLLESVFAIFFLTLLVGGTSQRSRLIVVCAYLVRVAMCYVHAYAVVLPDSQFDAVRFESVAWSWGRDQECINDFTTGSLLYSWIGSCVYSLFGRAALLLQVLNAFFGTLIVLVAMRTVRLLAKNRCVDQFVGWVLAIYPTLVLYSAITMREVAVVLTFCLSIYSLVRWRTGGRYIYGCLAVSWMIMSQLFHTGMLTGTVLVMCVFLYYTATDHWRRVWSLRVTVRDAKVRLVSIIGSRGIRYRRSGDGEWRIWFGEGPTARDRGFPGGAERVAGTGRSGQGGILAQSASRQSRDTCPSNTAQGRVFHRRAFSVGYLQIEGCMGIHRRRILVGHIRGDYSAV